MQQFKMLLEEHHSELILSMKEEILHEFWYQKPAIRLPFFQCKVKFTLTLVREKQLRALGDHILDEPVHTGGTANDTTATFSGHSWYHCIHHTQKKYFGFLFCLHEPRMSG